MLAPHHPILLSHICFKHTVLSYYKFHVSYTCKILAEVIQAILTCMTCQGITVCAQHCMLTPDNPDINDDIFICMQGHSSFVTHIDWSADSEFLQSNSGDYELLFWNAKTCKQVTSATTMRDTDWATFTCVLGFPVVGEYQEVKELQHLKCYAIHIMYVTKCYSACDGLFIPSVQCLVHCSKFCHSWCIHANYYNAFQGLEQRSTKLL